MLLLVSTSDKIRLTTGSAGDVDVHASYVDNNAGTITPGRLNTGAIATATTTDIVAAPAASTIRNVKTLHIRNTHATVSNTVTVIHTDGTTAVELHKCTLQPGDALEYIEGVGFFQLTAPVGLLSSANASDVTANAADTYLTGSSVNIVGRLKVGTSIRWRMVFTKTAAGTGTPTVTIRTGTNGSTSDTSRASWTGLAQTAATDTGWMDIEAVVRDASASGVLACAMRLQHKNTTTGIANAAQEQLFQTTTSAFDLTAAGLIIGVSCNPNTSGVWTFQIVRVNVDNNLN
jgi:hypothetical protein